jgi:RNA polymerase sigma-70 factor (sigma-E family)
MAVVREQAEGDGDGGDRPGRYLGGAESVFETEADSLVRFAYLLIGDRTRAEDVVADVFAASWRDLDAGRVANPSAYLRRSVANGARRHFRRLGRERRWRPDRVWSASIEDLATDRDLLLGALRRLPVRQRAVLVLRYWEDRSEAEVAEVLGISVGAVKSHASRGLARLKKELNRS